MLCANMLLLALPAGPAASTQLIDLAVWGLYWGSIWNAQIPAAERPCRASSITPDTGNIEFELPVFRC